MSDDEGTLHSTPGGLVARLHELEAAVRAAEAEIAVVVDAIERSKVYEADGHASLAAFLRGELRWSPRQITDRCRLVRLARRVPDVLDHLQSGMIGVAQAHALGRAAANPRCGEQIGEHAELLLEFARTLPYHHFTLTVQRWERLADADGAHRESEVGHANRSAHLTFHDGVGRVTAQCGALDFAQFSEIFERYREAEFAADWEAVVAEHGDDATPALLERSTAQRAWDALLRMALDAVSTPAGAQPPEPVVNLVCGLESFERELAKAGLIPGSALGESSVPASPDEWRCETTSGVPVAPTEVMLAAIQGRVRRVVFDSAGVVVDFGRLKRLFDVAAREAAILQTPTCVFPGCNRPSTWCQIDHLTEWRHGGSTDQRNAGPMCARHNRLKTSGFTVWRDERGVFHTFRPDGTELCPAPSPLTHAPPGELAAA